ncbi:MAG: DEAD/DEAH box helicase [Vicinamibacteria bacterium]|jgi:ATP-dependent RNA helicase DeaD|nr:DEAD/DEAH box helicase [Vicinamibacteria bacterium]
MELVAASKTFASLNLSPETLKSLADKGYVAPTDCQLETLPRALAGRDLIVQSRTGTGKTAAFGIPIVEKIDGAKAVVQALVLTPTRELAVQVAQEITELGAAKGLKVESIYGGDSMDRQLEGLRGGAQVVVGTPGRVLDHLRRGTISLTACTTLVLDEADRMLDMGFAVEMSEIMNFVPAERQTMLFSATIPLGIRGIIYHYMAEPEWILLSADQVYVAAVDHLYCLTPRHHKDAALYRLIEYEAPASSMIFCNTREEVRQVHAALRARSLAVGMLSSDLPQKKREKVLDAFRKGQLKHLVTTDVASRGIDIEDLSHVFIFTTPDSPEQYIHRAGRTGRVGKTGRAISLVGAHDLMNFNRLVKRYKIAVSELNPPTDEQVAERKADRLLERLEQDSQALSVEDLVDLAPLSRRLLAHPRAERLAVQLLKGHLFPVPADPATEEDDVTSGVPVPSADDAGAPGGGERRGGPGGRGRRGPRRGGPGGGGGGRR